MKKLFFIAALVVAAAVSYAQAFDDLAFEETLDNAAMASVEGQEFWLFVPFNAIGRALAVVHERNREIICEVPVTTVARAGNPNNPPKDTHGDEYIPVPLSRGTYPLGNTQLMSNPLYGQGIHIETTVSTPYRNKSESFDAGDYFVHSTPYSNTWGCVGVNSGMDKVMGAYGNSSGNKQLVVY